MPHENHSGDLPGVHIQPDMLREALDRLARSAPARDHLALSIEGIVVAMVPLFRVRGGSLLLLDEASALRHVMTTDDAADQLEKAQESTGEGPCIDALVNDVAVQTGDLHTDGRWPRLARQLTGSPIRAVLGLPVHVAGTPVGSLNVYVDRPYDWDDSDVGALRAFSAVVENTLMTALAAHRQEGIVDQLQRALDKRVVIERAVGLIMGRHDVTAVAAFDRLRRTARSQRRKVVDVATDVLEGKLVFDS